MKRKLLILIITSFSFLSGCTKQNEVKYEEKTYPVEARHITMDQKMEYVKYVGVLQPEQYVEKTFANFIEVEKVYVKEGDYVKVGDLLAKQNITDLEARKEELNQQVIQVEAEEEEAYQNMLAKKYAYEQAKNNQEGEKKDLYEEMNKAKTKMEESKRIVDQDQKEVDTAQKDFDEANTAYNDARLAYDQAVEKRDNTDPSDPNYAIYVEDVKLKETDMNNKETIKNEKQDVLNQKQQDLFNSTRIYNNDVAAYELALQQYNLAVDQGVSVDIEIANAEYNAALAAYDAAKTQTNITKSSYERADEDIANSYLYADIDGYVLKVLAKEGEVSNPLVPAIVLGSSETVVTIGLSQNNVRLVKEGMKALVEVGELEFEGTVLSIAKVPDSSSRTYQTAILFPENIYNFFIGETAVVEIVVGNKDGIWIPINVIQNDGEDYVFVIKDNRAVKKIIVPQNIDNDYVMVEGLDLGDLLITNGMKSLKPGYLVNVMSGDLND